MKSAKKLVGCFDFMTIAVMFINSLAFGQNRVQSKIWSLSVLTMDFKKPFFLFKVIAFGMTATGGFFSVCLIFRFVFIHPFCQSKKTD
jgi:hypothetical protein